MSPKTFNNIQLFSSFRHIKHHNIKRLPQAYQQLHVQYCVHNVRFISVCPVVNYFIILAAENILKSGELLEIDIIIGWLITLLQSSGCFLFAQFVILHVIPTVQVAHRKVNKQQ